MVNYGDFDTQVKDGEMMISFSKKFVNKGNISLIDRIFRSGRALPSDEWDIVCL